MDRQTDMIKLIVAFRNFVNVSLYSVLLFKLESFSFTYTGSC